MINEIKAGKETMLSDNGLYQPPVAAAGQAGGF